MYTRYSSLEREREERETQKMRHKGKQHFSHEHMLIPIELDEGEEFKCKACEMPIDDPFYGCPPCKYFLHAIICYDAPRSTVHPSHPSHPLALTPMPTYPSRSFTCNACGSDGNKGFSLSCAHCEFDLHLHCAELPGTFFYEREHAHDLKLVFEPSLCRDKTTNDRNIPCYICNEDQISWLYYCEECKYVVHMKCLYSKYDGKKETNGSDVASVEAGPTHGDDENVINEIDH
ncbi:hypothetical protein ABFS82_02G128000 [Erythranthe guttata]